MGMTQVINIDDYLKKIQKYNGYNNILFRGQSDNAYPEISCGIARNKGYLNNESTIINETLENRGDDFKGLELPVEHLAKMQHYGMPTRLIDVTSSPLIALFFAVENTSNLKDGEVFIFIKDCYDISSKQVKVTALLSKMKSYDLNHIKTLYETIYKENIDNDEILKYVNNNVFVEKSKQLKKSNERLFNQEGTFIVCENKIEDNTITNDILHLEKDEAALILRIPFEYKEMIKNELDSRYKINDSYIYPELTSFANYIRNKYELKDIELEEVYEITNEEDVPATVAKRKSIKIVLKRKLPINIIKQIVIEKINDKKIECDVVWIYVAGNNEDSIMCNWIISAIWINPCLDKKWWPSFGGSLDENNIRWNVSNQFAILNDYYDKNVFDDDKNLFIYNDKSYKIFRDIYIELHDIFYEGRIEEFKKILYGYKDTIRNEYMKIGDYGHSRNTEFNDFLQNYQSFAVFVDNLVIQLNSNSNSITERQDIYLFTIYMKEAEKYMELIESNLEKWIKVLNIVDDDYKIFTKTEMRGELN